MPSFDYRAELVKLARSFPSLSEAPGLDPFDFPRFQEWVRTKNAVMALASLPPQEFKLSRYALHAGQFIVNVWRGETWRVGAFDVVSAFQAWDDQHKEAFQAWVAAPWSH